MYPGYGDAPYHSPIRVDAVLPLGHRTFDLSFLNLGYAAGVQDFKKCLRTLKRVPSHQVCEEADNPERSVILTTLNPAWMHTHFPGLGDARRFFDETGQPKERALLSLAATAC